jgi:hypothetical protein
LQLHERVYKESSICWPPRISSSLATVAHEFAVTAGEQEILHLLEITCPMDSICCADAVVDLNLSIDRMTQHKLAMPIIVPKSRLWWRRAMRWVSADELMSAQGYGPTVASHEFSHKQVCDIMGNSFHAVPLMICVATVLATLGTGLGEAVQGGQEIEKASESD